MTKKKISFDAWIDKVGVIWLARYLKVHPGAVRHWRTKLCDPRVDHMRRIKKLTRGRISYDMMIDRRPITRPGTYTSN